MILDRTLRINFSSVVVNIASRHQVTNDPATCFEEPCNRRYKFYSQGHIPARSLANRNLITKVHNISKLRSVCHCVSTSVCLLTARIKLTNSRLKLHHSFTYDVVLLTCYELIPFSYWQVGKRVVYMCVSIQHSVHMMKTRWVIAVYIFNIHWI